MTYEIRPLNKNEQRLNAQRLHLQTHLIETAYWQCCLNCCYWTDNANAIGCAKYKAMPPANVIVIGCEEYLQEIPF